MNLKTLKTNVIFAARKKIGEYIAAPVMRFLDKLRFKRIARPEKIIEISPDDIGYWYTGNRFDEITFPGEIRGGDWSGNLISREERLANRSCYIGIREHFEEGVPWPETMLFKEKHPMLFEKNGRVKGTDTVKELEEYYKDHYDGLFKQVEEHGVLPATDENPDITPLYIHIGPDGEIIYTVDGNHRLYFSMILGIEKIPVRVWKRHKKWQQIRDHILSKNGKEVKEEYRKFLIHPDIVGELQ